MLLLLDHYYFSNNDVLKINFDHTYINTKHSFLLSHNTMFINNNYHLYKNL
jgi:hypothetical protein